LEESPLLERLNLSVLENNVQFAKVNVSAIIISPCTKSIQVYFVRIHEWRHQLYTSEFPINYVAPFETKRSQRSVVSTTSSDSTSKG
jgi:hypothetical protein